MSGFWRVRTRKPKGNVRINFAHPLARDIAFFYFDPQGTDSTGPTFYDAVTGLIGASTSGQTRTSQGTLAFSSARSTTTTAFSNYKAVQTPTQTVIARCKLTTKPADRTVPVFYGGNGNRGALVAFNSSGNAGGGQITTNGVQPAYDAIDHTGEWVVLAGWGETGGTSHGYVNGSPVGTALSGSAAAASIDRVTMGRDPTGYYNSFAGEVDWAIGFNRVLSDPEIKQISANPWQILEPQPDLGPFSLPSSGGGGVTVALTGISATGSLGSFGKSVSHALTGVSGTGSLGTLTPSVSGSVALTGIQGTGSVGNLTPKTSHALTGVSATGSLGTLTPNVNKNVALTGISGTGSLGSFGKSVSHALAGISATGALGTLTPSTSGSVTVALTGISATGFLGTLSPSVPLIIVDTHDGDWLKKKKRFDQELIKRKISKEQVIAAYEQIVEGRINPPQEVAKVIAPFVTKPATRTEPPKIDFDRLTKDLERAERLWEMAIEQDDEEVLRLL